MGLQKENDVYMHTYFDSEMIAMFNMMRCIRIDMNVRLHVDCEDFAILSRLKPVRNFRNTHEKKKKKKDILSNIYFALHYDHFY